MFGQSVHCGIQPIKIYTCDGVFHCFTPYKVITISCQSNTKMVVDETKLTATFPCIRYTIAVSFLPSQIWLDLFCPIV